MTLSSLYHQSVGRRVSATLTCCALAPRPGSSMPSADGGRHSVRRGAGLLEEGASNGEDDANPFGVGRWRAAPPRYFRFRHPERSEESGRGRVGSAFHPQILRFAQDDMARERLRLAGGELPRFLDSEAKNPGGGLFWIAKRRTWGSKADSPPTQVLHFVQDDNAEEMLRFILRGRRQQVGNSAVFRAWAHVLDDAITLNAAQRVARRADGDDGACCHASAGDYVILVVQTLAA